MNTHANVVFNATCYQQWMQLDRDDVVIGVAPFFHITGLIAHLAVAALAGMPIIMFYRFDPAEMLRLIEKWHGSFTVAAITVYIALLNHPDIRTRNLSSFRKAYSGGAPVSPAIVENFEKVTNTYIHDVYGLTARLLVTAAESLLAGEITQSGALAPAQAFDARALAARLEPLVRLSGEEES